MQTKITVRHYTDAGFGEPIGRYEILTKPEGAEHAHTLLLTQDDSLVCARVVEDTLFALRVPSRSIFGLCGALKLINPGVVTWTIHS